MRGRRAAMGNEKKKEKKIRRDQSKIGRKEKKEKESVTSQKNHPKKESSWIRKNPQSS
jgi:hypothetical protein